MQAVADAAYRHGAWFADAQMNVPGLQRSLILNGPAKAYVPAWADAALYGRPSGRRGRTTASRRTGSCPALDLIDRIGPARRALGDDEIRGRRRVAVTGGC